MPDEFEGTHDDEESKVSAQDEVCEDPPYEPPDEDYPRQVLFCGSEYFRRVARLIDRPIDGENKLRGHRGD